MKTITFKIHSFVDLITNSSSEVFVCAHEKTASTIHEVINSILKITNSELKSEDLFDIKMNITLTGMYNGETGMDYPETIYFDGSEEFENNKEYRAVDIDIKPKVTGIDVDTASKVLLKLKEAFINREIYN